MKPITIALLVALGASVFALWFFNTHHKVEEEQYVGPHGEARFNDHLAARLLLLELELDAESLATLTPTEWMPEVDDTLFLRLNASMTLGEEQAVLLDWLSGGGNLVLLPPRESVLDTERFLSEFGFSLVELEEVDDALESDAEATSTPSDTEPRTADNIQVGDEYQLSHWRNATIEVDENADNFVVVNIVDRTIAARRSWGDGYVTLFADDFFTNAYITEENDNGRLLLDVIAGDIEPNKIWMVYQTTFSPLWEVIWSSAPYLVISVFVLFLLWLWSVMPMFGPRVVAVEDERRSIIEHISAAGVFVWRRNGGDALAASAAEALIATAEKRHVGIGRQAPQQQAQTIARITGMSAQKVMDILSGPSGHRPKDFTNNMQKHQSIRKEL